MVDMGKVKEVFEREVGSLLGRLGISSVVAGISGGPDSVAMLLALVNCGVKVTPVHCNFHLRGDESDRDMNFVRKLCSDLGLSLHVHHVDVADYQGCYGVSVEMACRETRYAEFRRVMSLVGADRIAVAHNSDDQIETVFLNLMRGCGVAGMRGMLSDTGEIIRPLLSLDRRSILEYLDCSSQEYVVDSTNKESDYLRNFLRNDVIPLLLTRWPNAGKSVLSTAANMAQEERMLRHLEQLMTGGDRASLSIASVRECPDPAWLVRRFASPLGANNDQCKEIVRTVCSDDYIPGKFWQVDNGLISAERERLEFVPDNGLRCPASQLDVTAFVWNEEVAGMVASAPLSELWTSLQPSDILLRPVKEGDRIKPLGMSGSTKISKIMKDAKLSRASKLALRVAVVKESGEIIWVPGFKRSRLALADETSGVVFRYKLCEASAPVADSCLSLMH